jgi:hypothetical protein
VHVLQLERCWLLSHFRRVRKIGKSVCLSVYMEQLGSHWTTFY